METIQSFLDKHSLNDCLLEFYTSEDIEKIVCVINGDLSDCEDNGYSANYVGICIEKSLFNKINQEKDAEYYYLIGVKANNALSMCNLANLYENKNDFELAEKYYLMAIEHEHDVAMNNLGYVYFKQNKYELAEKYYLMAIKHEYDVAMSNLGYVYFKQNKYELAEKYYLMSIERGNNIAMFNLGHLYFEQNKPELAEKYCLMSIENGYENAIANLCELLKQNKLKLYVLLSNIKNKTAIIQQKIYSLSSIPEISSYINRKNVWGKVGDCSVCLNNALLVPMECTHFYCEECYVKVEKCFCKNLI